MDIFSTPSVWEKLKTEEKPIVIYGMGNGSDKLIDRLDSLGVKISGIMASDDFVRGQSFRSFTVKKLSDFENELCDFIILVAFGSHLSDVIEHIKSIAKNHTVLAPQISVYNDEIIDEEFLKQNCDKIHLAYNLLADEKSKEVFYNLLAFMYSGELSYLFLSETSKHEAFLNILKLHSEESYLDLGAYRGDTIDEFLHYCDEKYKSIVAVEPDIKTFKKLCEHTKNLENTKLYNNAVYSHSTTLAFSIGKGRGSSSKGSKTVDVSTLSVDEICTDFAPTYIKVDIEGLENEMLIGAKKTLKSFKPKLNLAAYHKNSDLFNLVLQLNKINPDYKIYLRHHPYIPAWDTNLYCV